MAQRLHTTTQYQVKYGSGFNYQVTDKIISLAKRIDGDCGLAYVNDDETIVEFYGGVLTKIINKEYDANGYPLDDELMDAIETIIDESDSRNDFYHLELF